jgi:hypothetical protein
MDRMISSSKVSKVRWARWLSLSIGLVTVWACNTRQLEAPRGVPTQTFNTVFQESLNRDLDILFEVDNSQSMKPLQKKLLDNFPMFMQQLADFPTGLPNVHIAVVSSNMGAGRNAFDTCPLGGDKGIFQNARAPNAPATCTTTGLNPGQTFIIDTGSGTANHQTNYDPGRSIADVFTCIAALGDQGCGFEHQLASVSRALGADSFDAQGNPQPPPQNAGFLRKDAYLAIVIITNEDDCSAPSDSDLFNPSSCTVNDPLGPFASFRCNEYGHLCNGQPPVPHDNRLMDVSYPPGACVSAEDGVLLRVQDQVKQIRALKADPRKILVAVIGGLPNASPYHVEPLQATPNLCGDPGPWPGIAHACEQPTAMGSDPENADPGIRLGQFVQGFGDHGLYLTICADSFKPALDGIAYAIGQVIGPACIEGTLVDKDRDRSNGVQPDCTVTDHTSDGDGKRVDSLVPPCADVGGTPPCWQLADGTDKACPGSKLLSINRAGPPPIELDTSVSCAVCIPGAHDPAGDPAPGC